MAYKFPNGVSYSRMRRYTSQVIGGLKARPQVAAKAEDWRALRAGVVQARAEREVADDAVLEAFTWTRVEDVGWDRAILAVSSRSYELAGKDAAEEPYVTLFGAIDAKRAQTLGPAKATEVGGRVVRDGRRLDADGLGTQLGALEVATTRLGEAKAAVDAAEDGLFPHRQAKKKLVRQLNSLIAVTEAAILTAFPGADDVVSAILLPWFERKTAKKAADEPAPEPITPDLDEDGEGEDEEN